MIKSFAEIKNLAVFRDFVWDDSVRDGNGRPLYFKDINILYGRNYSGKTTLSRIMRSLETGELSAKYGDPQFKVALDDETTITQDSRTVHNLKIRVFNEDFVREHLSVFFDDKKHVTAFAVLGKDNVDLAKELAVKEAELGAEEKPGSLVALEAACREAHRDASFKHKQATDKRDELLRNEARRIRGDRLLGQSSYDLRHIRSDIPIVKSRTYVPLSEEKVAEYEATLKETARPAIPECPALDLKFAGLASEAEKLASQTVRPSNPIQDLLDDAVLQEWVRTGRPLHERKRKTCGFCGGTLSADLWTKLDEHFSEQSEALREKLESLIDSIDTERQESSGLLEINPSAFYSSLAEQAKLLEKRTAATIKQYQASLKSLRSAVEKRLRDIFTPSPLPAIGDVSTALQGIWNEYDALRTRANEHTASLTQDQAAAGTGLLLHRISSFLATIHDEDLLKTIEANESKEQDTKKRLQVAQRRTSEAREAIESLKARMRDERAGAEKVNEYLRSYLGHPALSLEVVTEAGDTSAQCRFEIRRESQRAFHLSEGERGLLAFCYFMARLEDIETSSTKPIIWIDDPISSLDDNHVFFIYTLIRDRIVHAQRYEQLFISTHNLSFLKYLKRIKQKRKKRMHLLVERRSEGTVLTDMPKHIRVFATEFHYLFHRIHECAHSNDDSDLHVFYNFGNNLRKFLEIYLYFRYPDGDDEADLGKLRKFLGSDDLAASSIDRVAHEGSHLRGLFERGCLPVETPSVKKMAQLVLDKMKEHDKDQYDSLLRSINAPPDPSATPS